MKNGARTCELHHHVGKHVQESHHERPRRLCARLCWFPVQGPWVAKVLREHQVGRGCETAPPAPRERTLPGCAGEAVEHLFSHRHCLGKIPLALLLNDILAGVVPVEVADGLLAE